MDSVTLYLKRLLICIQTAFPDIIAHRYRYRAAALSYYTIVSIIPLIIVCASIMSIFPFEGKDLAATLYQVLPRIPVNMEAFIETVMTLIVPGRKVYGLLSFFTAYYFASSLFLALHHTLHGIFCDPHITTKKEIVIQIVSIPIFILGLFTLYFGGHLITQAMEWLIHIETFQKMVPEFFQTNFFILITNTLTFFSFWLLIFLMYHFMRPDTNRSWLNSIVMTTIIGFIFTCLKYIFATAIGYIAQINPFYGAFGGVFAFFAWIFQAFMVILIGARTLYLLEATQLGVPSKKSKPVIRSQPIDRFKDEEFLS
ncbi:hypothetical protein HOH87_03860 [bacterium]|nr:hypothetical protein [bacterium]